MNKKKMKEFTQALESYKNLFIELFNQNKIDFKDFGKEERESNVRSLLGSTIFLCNQKIRNLSIKQTDKTEKLLNHLTKQIMFEQDLLEKQGFINEKYSIIFEQVVLQDLKLLEK